MDMCAGIWFRCMTNRKSAGYILLFELSSTHIHESRNASRLTMHYQILILTTSIDKNNCAGKRCKKYENIKMEYLKARNRLAKTITLVIFKFETKSTYISLFKLRKKSIANNMLKTYPSYSGYRMCLLGSSKSVLVKAKQ
jgi:hypothetical protein